MVMGYRKCSSFLPEQSCGVGDVVKFIAYNGRSSEQAYKIKKLLTSARMLKEPVQISYNVTVMVEEVRAWDLDDETLLGCPTLYSVEAKGKVV